MLNYLKSTKCNQIKAGESIAQKDLSNMQTHGKQDNKYVGLIYCGDCGANMVRRYYYSEKNGVLYYNYYFICGNYAKISRENITVIAGKKK